MKDCSYLPYCSNSKACSRCVNQSLLKLPQKYKTLKPKREKAFDYKTANEDDSWKDLEQRFADKINVVPPIEQARRSRASGALWFEKGDIVDNILHPECKERSGEKSFAMQREWLEKAKKECEGTDKTMCLPFRFKGDENIYVVFDSNDIVNLVTTMKSYMHDNERLQQENLRLKIEIAKDKEGGR